NVLERIAVVQTKATSHHVLTGSSHVIGKANSWTEVLVAVVGQLPDVEIGDWVVDRDQLLVGTASGYVLNSKSIDVLVPAQAEIQGQSGSDLPVVLKIESYLLRTHKEGRVTRRERHAAH